MSKPVVTLVVPCYNEEEILPHTIDVLHALIKEYINDELISEEVEFYLLMMVVQIQRGS